MTDPESFFFVNANNAPLSKLQNTPGSWMEKIGNVTKIEKLNITHLRKSAEYYIQESDKLRGRSKTLNYHSDDVGVHFYNDPLAERAEFVNYVDQRETPKKIKRRSRSFDLDRAQRKKKMEEEDKVKKIENAKRLLEAADARRKDNLVYGKRLCVKPNHRLFLQRLIVKECFTDGHINFPKGDCFVALLGLFGTKLQIVFSCISDSTITN